MPEIKHPINHDWDEYYEMLEFIRRTGVTNMWGAAPYLKEGANISYELAKEVLLSWIENYDELNKQFHWQ